MTAHDQAQIGLRLLRDAILVYLAAHPEGRTPRQVREDLGLLSADSKGERADYLMWGLGNLLESAGQVRRDQPDGRHNVLFLVTPTENTSQPEAQGSAPSA
jgi:hypothetical protein